MQVAIVARVSTLNQRQEGRIASQIQLLKQHIQQQSWSLLGEAVFNIRQNHANKQFVTLAAHSTRDSLTKCESYWRLVAMALQFL
jgi:hypothetical protein